MDSLAKEIHFMSKISFQDIFKKNYSNNKTLNNKLKAKQETKAWRA